MKKPELLVTPTAVSEIESLLKAGATVFTIPQTTSEVLASSRASPPSICYISSSSVACADLFSFDQYKANFDFNINN